MKNYLKMFFLCTCHLMHSKIHHLPGLVGSIQFVETRKLTYYIGVKIDADEFQPTLTLFIKQKLTQYLFYIHGIELNKQEKFHVISGIDLIWNQSISIKILLAIQYKKAQISIQISKIFIDDCEIGGFYKFYS